MFLTRIKAKDCFGSSQEPRGNKVQLLSVRVLISHSLKKPKMHAETLVSIIESWHVALMLSVSLVYLESTQ